MTAGRAHPRCRGATAVAYPLAVLLLVAVLPTASSSSSPGLERAPGSSAGGGLYASEPSAHLQSAVKDDLLGHARLMKHLLQTKDRRRRSSAVDATLPCLAIRDQWIAQNGNLPVQECDKLEALIHMSASDTLTCGGSLLTQYRNSSHVESICTNACFKAIVDILRLMVLENEPCTPGMIFEDSCQINSQCGPDAICIRGRCEPTCDPGNVDPPSNDNLDCGCGEQCLQANGGHVCMRDPVCNTTTSCPAGMNCVDGLCFNATKPILQQTTMYHFKTYQLLCARDSRDNSLCYSQLQRADAAPDDCEAYVAMQDSCCLYTWSSYEAGCAYDAYHLKPKLLSDIAARCNFTIGVVKPCAGYPSSSVTSCYSSVSASVLRHEVIIKGDAPLTDAAAVELAVAARLGMNTALLSDVTLVPMETENTYTLSYELTTRLWPNYTDVSGALEVYQENVPMRASILADTRTTVRLIPAVRKSGGGMHTFFLGEWAGILTLYGAQLSGADNSSSSSSNMNMTCCTEVDYYDVSLHVSPVELEVSILEFDGDASVGCESYVGGTVRVSEIEALTTPGTYLGTLTGLG